MDKAPPLDNVAGAIIFICYVAAALALSIYILASIHRTSQHAPNDRSLSSWKGQLVTNLTALSFSLLTMSMLGFLIAYYRAWAAAYDVPLPANMLEILQGKLDVWTWLRDSTLFQSFAETLCNDPARLWWTQAALMYSIAWSIFMASDGARRGIPNLWAYFVLMQILPTSFAQNLYVVAVYFQPPRTEQSPGANVRSAQGQTAQAVQAGIVALVVAYFRALRFASQKVGTELFMPTVLATRALLFAPYVLLASPLMSRYSLHIPPRYSTMVAALSGVALMVRQVLVYKEDFGGSSAAILQRLIEAVQGELPVSALGYDFIVGIVSLAAFRTSGVLH